MNKLSSVFAILSVAFLMHSIECVPVQDLTTSTPFEEPECICTFEFRPVCANNGETFSNPCLFQCEADSQRGKLINLLLAHEGPCEEVAEMTSVAEEEPECICTFQFNPVCANNGQTFSNPCLFQCEADSQRGKLINLLLAHEGPCEEDSEEFTPTAVEEDQATDADEEEENCICTFEFNPLCGSNGQTYSNPCLFRCDADTKHGQFINLQIAHFGACADNE